MINKNQKKSNQYSNINQSKDSMKEEDDKIAKLKVSLYGKRFFIGNGSSSIG